MAKRAGIRRIGVLTGGGDCAGLNAVLRAVIKTAIFDYDLEVWGIEDGFLGLIENRMHLLTSEDASNILTRGGTILGTSNRSAPHYHVTGYRRDKTPIIQDVTTKVVKHIKSRKLDALVTIGGDGTMSGAARLLRHGIPMIGVPKTIDNDIAHCDLTFGFQTAVEIATEALDRIHTTAASHHRVMIVETMGRNAGWLALHAGLASGTDIILIPEMPYSLESICDFCHMRAKRRKSFTIIAVAEGAHPAGGEMVVDKLIAESPDPVRLGGISTVLAEQIGDCTGLECRSTILGHVQRGGTPCAFDRILATQFGHHAVHMVMEKRWNHMVTWRNGKIGMIPIEKVAGRQRRVPINHPLIAAARSVGTCFGA